MKEIKKLSELIIPFISSINKKMNLKSSFFEVYSIWDDLVKKEDLPLDSKLEDINKNTVIIQVNHSGSAQQIRMKAKKIINTLNKQLSSFKIKDLKVLINVFNNS